MSRTIEPLTGMSMKTRAASINNPGSTTITTGGAFLPEEISKRGIEETGAGIGTKDTHPSAAETEMALTHLKREMIAIIKTPGTGIETIAWTQIVPTDTLQAKIEKES